MSCSVCARPLADDARFCSHCGSRVAAAPQTGPLGDRRVVTVLFADVSGYTALSERLDPEAVADLINRFFQVLTAPILRYGGTVDKYIGDAVMALFGAPVAHEDDPVRAVLAAHAMQGDAAAFAAELQAETGIQLKLRIGLNTGLVVAGAVGGDQRQDYTVMGDTVNLAQRMEAAAEPGTVLVSPRTFQLTSAEFRYDALEPIRVKGKADPVAVYRLVGPRAAAADPVADRHPLVGRPELSAPVLAAVRQGRTGTPSVLALVGAAGLGKSRLMREAARWWQALSPVEGPEQGVVRLRCTSYGRTEAYGALRPVLAALAGAPPDSARLEALAASFAPEEAAQVADLLGLLIGHEPQTPAIQHLAPERQRRQALDALVQGVVAAARRAPLLVLVEDVHWADGGTRAWLGALAETLAAERDRGASLPCLLLLTARPEGGTLPGVTLPVRPLTDPEAWTLARQVLDLAPDAPPEPSVRQIVDGVLVRADGNPSFVIEALTAWRERGAPTDEALAALPTSLASVVAARLDGLPPDQKAVLQAAAVLGRAFDPQVLATLGRAPRTPELLEALVQRGLLRREPDGELAFDQVLTQEVAYEGLLLASRKELHRRAAEALEGNGPGLAPHAIAHHYTQADVPAKAATYLYLAGESARRRYANPEARRALEQALAARGRIGEDAAPSGVPSEALVRIALAEVCETTGAYDEAQAHLEAVLAPSKQEGPPAERAEVLRRLGNLVAERRGDYQGALERFEEGIYLLAGQDEPVVHARLLLDLARLTFRQGSYDRCAAFCEQALAGTGAGDLPRELALARSLLGLVAYRQHRFSEAIAHHQEALRLRLGLQDGTAAAASLSNLGVAYLELGDWGLAAHCYQDALDTYRRAGDVGLVAGLQNNLGELRRKTGDLTGAVTLHDEALAWFEGTGDARGRATALANRGCAHLEAGDPGRALTDLAEALAAFRTSGFAELETEVLNLVAAAQLRTGDLSAAQSSLDEASSRARAEGNRQEEAIATRTRAQLLLARGLVPEALAAARLAVEGLSEVGNAYETARAQAVVARCARADGDADLAREATEAARGTFARLGARRDLDGLETESSAVPRPLGS